MIKASQDALVAAGGGEAVGNGIEDPAEELAAEGADVNVVCNPCDDAAEPEDSS